MAQVTADHRGLYARLSASAGGNDSVKLGSVYRSVSITVHPGTGGTAEVDISTRPHSDIDAGNADWVPVDFNGSDSVSEKSGIELPESATGVRLRAVGAAATANLNAVA